MAERGKKVNKNNPANRAARRDSKKSAKASILPIEMNSGEPMATSVGRSATALVPGRISAKGKSGVPKYLNPASRNPSQGMITPWNY
jgi:hypothetical protein